jgi:predicted metal-dependent peptidase
MIWNRASDYLADTVLVTGELKPSKVSQEMVPPAVQAIVKDKTTEEVYYQLLKQGEGKGGGEEGEGQESLQPGEGDEGPAIPSSHHDKKNPRGCASASIEKSQLDPGMAEKMKQLIVGAAQFSKDRGDCPGFAEDFVVQIKNASITWRDILRAQATNTFKGRYSFHKPSRRSQAIGVMLPSRKPAMEAAIVMIDTSGSISDGELIQFVSECAEIMRCCNAENIKIYFHDVMCYHHETYTPHTISNIKVTRGGTSHIDVFAKVMAEEPKIGMVVAFTDLYTCFPPIKPDFPVMWAHSPDSGHVDVPFGEKVKVDLNA